MKEVMDKIEKMREEIIDFTMDMIKIPAVNPAFGGKGEEKRAEFLEKKLNEICDEVKRYNFVDENGLTRPNLGGIVFGNDTSRTIWILSHMDTVPEGDKSLWSYDPYDPVIKDEKIYGRGTLDDGQGIVSSYFAAKAIIESGKRPKYNLGLIFVSDEEAGSKYGIKMLMDKNLFLKDDLVIVPDAGNENGSFLEIAEKSAAWLKIKTEGKQTHASIPHKGLNAHRIGMKFALKVDEFLHKKYSYEDRLFDPPLSTFEMTKKERNVDNINTIPGTDIFYFDFRVLPRYNIDDVIGDVRKIASEISEETGAKINVEIVQKSQAAPPTPENSEIVVRIKDALKELRGIYAHLGGIGGGTVASVFRRMNIPAVVWMTADEVEHQPDEFCRIKNCVEDAKVFAHVALK